MMGAGIPSTQAGEHPLIDNSRGQRRSLRFLLPTSLLSIGVLLILLGVDLAEFRSWLDRCGPWAPLVFLFAGVLMMSVLVPKTVVSITAGALFGTIIGSFLMLFTAVAAAVVNYWIGRWWLFDSIQRRLQIAASCSDLDRVSWLRAVRELAADAGFGFHLLVRMAPLPTTLISYTMGASGSRLGPFIAAAAVAVIPQMLWVHGGTVAMMIDDPQASGLRWTGALVSIAAAVAISVIVPRQTIRRLTAWKALHQNGAAD